MSQPILLANPRGFCAGVDRAISIVERALEEYGAPIYVRHEVVHNKFVVDDLRNKGAIFIEELSDVPEGATLIYSAHGVSLAVQEEAISRGFRIFDATCPLVTKVHKQVQRLNDEGYQIIMIGHKGHPEVEGTMGQVREGGMLLVEVVEDVARLEVDDVEKLAHVSQTTLSVDETFDIIEALKARFPHIKSPNKEDICYATTNRQEAVKKLASECDIVIVVGSPNSSNSNRLREVAALLGVDAYMVDNATYLEPAWFEGKKHVGVTAGASAPELLVQGVIAQIQEWGHGVVEELSGVEESIIFVLPKELR
ncbi:MULTISPECIES: 4-hydroxy-3-methylbut-2-enyl diphosphate reductase [Vitreoscilla]|uniref:4-hydroxy-3-methylbut-2-enyl diphosphate reductase n=1 Tax=Vitreoscilla stercoraria TaxID=61 RepID=A0ABY4EDS1_VITST|nr:MULTISPECIES: 4-hydroxy-3-methylbut-2-enyl diphosphate reductase [Vitreoscilla]QJQ52374.1 4-hydroxy-3-methylbut-2-enyl diphosphate reductase [Vitreoscilla sp. C1]UOO92823.1 4-hydroxy-3-methylbut-2-enyl diphosphate reductase [Vitreoscilla stercoraria]